MQSADDLHWASERYLSAYLTMESLIPGFHQDRLNGLRHIRYGRPKDGIEHEMVLGALESTEALAVLTQLPDLDRVCVSVCVSTLLTDETMRICSAAGYELVYRNVLMVCDLERTDGYPDAAVHEVTDIDRLEWLARVRDDNEPRTSYLTESSVRCFSLQIDGVPVSSAILITVDDTTTVLEEVLTLAAHRQRGYGARLVRSLHTIAASTGTTRIVLASTDIGRALYQSLGYRALGTVLVWRRDPDK